MRRSLVLALAMILAFGAILPAQARAEEKIAVVDIQALMGKSKAGGSIETQINKQRDSFKTEFSKLEKELADLQKGLEKVDQKSEDFAKKRGELEKRMMEANRLVQERRQLLDRAAAKAIGELEREIVQTVGEVAKSDGYTLVVRTQSIIVAESQMDITEKVLAALDKKVSTIKVTMDDSAKADAAAAKTTKKN